MLKFRFPSGRAARQSHSQSQASPLDCPPCVQPVLVEPDPNGHSRSSSSLAIPSTSPVDHPEPTTSLNESSHPPASSLLPTGLPSNQVNLPNNPQPSSSSSSSSSSPLQQESLSAQHHHPIIASRKTRRKSYGGLRAILGITRPEDPPPLPTPDACRPPHQSHPSFDASSPSGSLVNFPPPPSPITTESRPSTSSLRPFPFLSGIRRKSANSNASKPNTHLLLHHNQASPQHLQDPRPSSPSSSNLTPQKSSEYKYQSKLLPASSIAHYHRFYTHSSKKAQSVDDLSQFGLLPKPKIKPRRSEELFETKSSQAKPDPTMSKATSVRDSTDLHQGLDQIGELAESLAKISTKNDENEDRQPRLSNPKGMRTVYGVPIEDLYWRDGESFPLLVDVLVQLIEEKGLDQQGIYRVPGEKRVIENIQASIDERGVNGVDIWKDSYKDVHNLSGLLKLFLREIPGGVIPFDRYDRFLSLSGVQDEDERTGLLKQLVQELPVPNLILLLRLVRHFERVVEQAESNSMLAHNVAIVFAPSLFRSGSEHSNPLLSMQNIGKASAIVRHLVLNADRVFGKAEEENELTIGRSVGRGVLLKIESGSNSAKDQGDDSVHSGGPPTDQPSGSTPQNDNLTTSTTTKNTTPPASQATASTTSPSLPVPQKKKTRHRTNLKH